MISNKNSPGTRLSRYDNGWYKPGPGWKIALWMVVSAVFFNNGLAVLYGYKCWLLRRFGAKVGRRVVLKTWVSIKYPWFLEIADDVWIGENVWIDNLAPVKIGANVCISQGVYLLTGNHDYTKTTFDLMVSGLVLEDGVWLGAKSTVCPGVICGSHAMLSVGSIATKNLDAFGIYKGNPAQKIKTRIIK